MKMRRALKVLKCLLIIQLLYEIATSQTIPIREFSYKKQNVLFDSGRQWNILSNINSLRRNNDTTDNKKILGKSFLDFNISKNSSFISFFGDKYFKNSLYSYADINILNASYFEKNKDDNINNLLSIQSSGLGFRNSWVDIRLVRGSENWGSGNNISLALSHFSPSYDYVGLSSDYGRLRVNYIHGFLEQTEGQVNRYINARGLEWTNKKSIILSLTETVIYSGVNRPIDMAYFNPIGSHLEIELNNRLNFLGTYNSNAVWQAHLDLLLKNKIRLSLNYLFDEFVLDPEIELKKEHGKAFSFRASCNLYSNLKKIINIYFSHVYVGTPTFRHGMGTNNFVQKGKPLGWENGSDGKESSLGLVLLLDDDLILDFTLGKITSGGESILKQPYLTYSDYLKGEFPSGKISNSNYIDMEFLYDINRNFSFGLEGSLKETFDGERLFLLSFSIAFMLP